MSTITQSIQPLTKHSTTTPTEHEQTEAPNNLKRDRKRRTGDNYKRKKINQCKPGAHGRLKLQKNINILPNYQDKIDKSVWS